MMDHAAAEARLRLYAEVIGKDAPARLLDEDNAPSEELCLFCAINGASLDWNFLGDQRQMILDSYNRATFGHPTVKDSADLVAE